MNCDQPFRGLVSLELRCDPLLIGFHNFISAYLPDVVQNVRQETLFRFFSRVYVEHPLNLSCVFRLFPLFINAFYVPYSCVSRYGRVAQRTVSSLCSIR